MRDSNAYYGRIIAQYYERMFKSFDKDIPFYLEECSKVSGPILEIGCGTGRVLIPIAEAGFDIVGVDLSADMLAVARAKIDKLPTDVAGRISLFEGDMQDFSIPQEFPLAIIPFRAFLHLLSPESQRNALFNIASHLAPQGKLIISVFDPRLSTIVSHTGANRNVLIKLKEISSGDGTLTVWETRAYDPLNQIVHCGRIFEEFDNQGQSKKRLQTNFDLRFSYRYEMQYLFELCGYAVANLFGTFDRGPFVHGGEQIWILEKKGNSRRAPSSHRSS